jgi:hypothetical protein
MRAILIDPIERKVTEIEIEGKDYREFYPILGCELYSAGLRFDNEDMMLIDDEGLFKNPDRFFVLAEDYPRPIAGRAIIVGTDDSGDTAPCQLTLEHIAKQVQWVDRVGARPYVMAERVKRERMKREAEARGINIIDVNMDDYFFDEEDV